jgi:predicted DNA repair protein MutK
MFLVGGGILVHGIPALHHVVEHWVAGQSWGVAALIENGSNGLTGIVAGAVVLGVVMAVQKLRGR